MKIIQRLLVFTTLFSCAIHAQEPAQTLDELLRRVEAGVTKDSQRMRELVDQFTRKRNDQATLLETAATQVRDAEQQSELLRQQINKNELQLDALNKQLDEKLGNFGELFGVSRQVATDTSAQIADSLVSAEFLNRLEVLDRVSTSQSLPTIEDLRGLWQILLQEQIEQGRISKFDALVNKHGQKPSPQSVIRVGPFTAISEQQFVKFDSNTQQLTLLGQQPPSLYRHSANVLSNAQPGDIVKATLDPSRGAILDLFIEMPSNWDRFQQGGLPGYVVTFLALVGMAIGLFRLFYLMVISAKVRRQTKTTKINSGNPLGRVLKVYDDNPTDDTETLELKLTDAIVKESPKLESGLNTLKVLAAVAPLLGLLGTVIGMIETFQAITLWGTGDPKLMANGISQALVTTVQGLLAAIPLLLLHSMASGRAKFIQQILEEQSAGLIARRADTGRV